MRAAAVQLEPVIGDVAANLQACERLADGAAAAGAELIVLPEFFTTGMGFVEAISEATLPPDGAATQLLTSLSKRHGAIVGGSFLCRDDDGEVRNAFFLVTPDGIAGRHDKDIPTMWENCFYVGGTDRGMLEAGGLSFGVALCWEFIRTQTARRLRGSVDLVVGGSFVWGPPDRGLPPGIRRTIDDDTDRIARDWAPLFARRVGAPVVEAVHCGRLEGGMPWSPTSYRGRLRGGAQICDASGTVLARREGAEGEGVVVADIAPGRTEPVEDVPPDFYAMDVSRIMRLTQRYQTAHGRRWYRRNAARRATARV